MSERDLFISHSSGDADQARSLRTVLEAAGYTCWMAPDDVTASDPWASQILAAIESCRAMIVLISARSNGSSHVAREVELANARQRIVLPIRVEDVRPAGALEYHIAGLQRTDAFPPPIDRHRDAILRRVSTTVPVETGTVPPVPVEAVPATPAIIAEREPRSGFSAWARANSMLTGVAVTLVALFVVGAAAMALNGAGPAHTATATIAPSHAAAASPTIVPGPSALSSAQPAASRDRPATGANGAFPTAAEADLFLSLPAFAARTIEDCSRVAGDPGIAVARIECYAANGELVYYTRWPDLDALRADYHTELRVIMDNPTGDCATSPAGDSAWMRDGQVAGRVACQLWDGGPSVEFYWTDEARLVTAQWFGTGTTQPEDDRALGYAVFAGWIAE